MRRSWRACAPADQRLAEAAIRSHIDSVSERVVRVLKSAEERLAATTGGSRVAAGAAAGAATAEGDA
jgi:hypothetical protein